jgi:Ras-related protein Rab-2A
LVDWKFEKEYTPTLGVDVHVVNLGSESVKDTCVNVWDIAGKYKSISNNYNSFADGTIVMFSFVDRTSYTNIPEYIESIKSSMGVNHPILICGSKCDKKQRKVSYDELSNFLSTTNLQFLEVSAKSCYNYTNVLTRLISIM